MTATNIDPVPEPPYALDPTEILMTLIIALLAPMFLGVAGGDIGAARMAAIATLSDYRVRNSVDLIAVAQIIAFGLAALGSLSLSLADDITVNLAIRLCGNANACNRSAEQNRRVLRQSLAGETQGRPMNQPLAAGKLVTTHQPPVPSRAPAPTQTEKLELWTSAMVQEANEMAAEVANLPPEQREAAAKQAATLKSIAHELLRSPAAQSHHPGAI